MVLPTFLYLLETTNLTGSDIVFIFSTVSKETEAAAMNGADQLRMEGRVEVNRKLVKGALKLGMDAKTIADTFEMDFAEVVSLIEQVRQEKP